MTWRSILLGLAGASTICGLSFINDRVLKLTFLVGNNMPIAVFGLLIVFLAAINPLLQRLRLTGKEMAVVLAMTLAACCVPGAGLLRSFTGSLIMPYHFNKIEAGWKGAEVLEMAPKRMLADISQDEDKALGGFVQGMSTEDGHVAVKDVPWWAWKRTLTFWIPLIIALWALQIGLSLLFHKQWASHEHLSYPIAKFTSSLMSGEGQKGGVKSVLRSRLFWIPATIVVLIYFNNFLCRWNPDYLITVPTRFDFSTLAQLFPILRRGGGTRLLVPTIYLTVVGIAFLIPDDVSLAFGIGPFLWALLGGLLATYGMGLADTYGGRDAYMGLNLRAFLLFGANLGVFITVLYTGRQHLKTVFLSAIRPTAKVSPEERSSVFGCRIMIVAFVVFTGLLAFTGIGLVTAILYAGILVIFFTVMSRLIAESGLFYIQPFFHPCVILWGLFGVRALGLETLLILQILSMVFTIDPRESLMPFMTNSLRLLDLQKVEVRRPAKWCAVAVVVGLLVALPITLYIQYDQGAAVWDGWGDLMVPKKPFANATVESQRLAAQGVLESAKQSQGTLGLFKARPHPACMVAMGAGLLLFLLFAVARLRLKWWPIHPLIFVTWGTEPLWRLSGSFLLGWMIKVVLTKYGGVKIWERLKPLMYGLIAGEILGALVPSIFGAIYYLVTREPPKPFRIMPG